MLLYNFWDIFLECVASSAAPSTCVWHATLSCSLLWHIDSGPLESPVFPLLFTPVVNLYNVVKNLFYTLVLYNLPAAGADRHASSNGRSGVEWNGVEHWICHISPWRQMQCNGGRKTLTSLERVLQQNYLPALPRLRCHLSSGLWHLSNAFFWPVLAWRVSIRVLCFIWESVDVNLNCYVPNKGIP